jgi:lactoylglutathione lyase
MRMLHTMLRVGNLERSLAFVGYGPEASHTVLELTHNWDTERYDLGDGFGHVAFGVDDVYATCETLRARGAPIVREPGPMKHGSSHIAFIEDPDGYRIELIQLRGRTD